MLQTLSFLNEKNAELELNAYSCHICSAHVVSSSVLPHVDIVISG